MKYYYIFALFFFPLKVNDYMEGKTVREKSLIDFVL